MVSEKIDSRQAFLSASEYRQYAYFRVMSSLPLGHVGDVLELEPIRYWDKGDSFESRGKTFERKFSNWALESGCLETEPFEAHFNALLEMLEPRAQQLAIINEQHECAIVCVAYSLQSCGFEMSADLMRRLAALGLSVELDAYGMTDPHDEIENLRSLIETAQSI